MRKKLGMTQMEFAAKFCISVATLRHWYRGNGQLWRCCISSPKSYKPSKSLIVTHHPMRHSVKKCSDAIILLIQAIQGDPSILWREKHSV
ncbi:helix-turn-helix domain-containing protein [Vreelandella nigrificans]|uniref:helix-turn-helix domain-containing protein n=1 Tax=Vreelandella nigrificans TaxID=2042704 RepID=UPI003BF5341B